MQRPRHLQLPLVFLVAACNFVSATAQSFESQFSSPTFYALAIAGISLGAAITAALLGLLLFCLVRRRMRLGRKPKRLDTEASNSTSSQQQQQPPNAPGASKKQHRTNPPVEVGAPKFGGGGGGIALPLPPVQKPHPAGSGGSSNNGGSSGPAMAKYVNPAFDSHESGAGSKTSSGGAAGLYRNSSALRPVSYASLESSNKSRGSGTADRPVISHAVARTSPAGTQALDPRHYLSDGALNLAGSDPAKRMSYVEPPELNHQASSRLEKRLSYAEKRAQIGSGLELASGQVFFASSLQRQQPQQQQQLPASASLPRTLIQPTVLATQHEEPTSGSGRVGGLDGRRQLQPHLEEGPSFPRTGARSPSPRPPPSPPAQLPKAPAAAVSPPLPQKQPPKNLRRFQLGDGVGGDDNDRRSVTSTVLKQEAIQAFEFLDNYEDEN